jgi:bacterioferritin
MADHPFVTDIQTLRARARHHIEQGAVTEGYRADRETVIRLLQEALATELVCVLRYKPMVLVSDKPSNDIGILQTKLRHREGHEARRVGV